MAVMSINAEVNEAAGRTKTREASTPLLRGPEHSMRAREPQTEEEAVAKARAHALMAGPPRWDGEDVATRVKEAVCEARRKWQAPQDLREAPVLTTAGADAPPRLRRSRRRRPRWLLTRRTTRSRRAARTSTRLSATPTRAGPRRSPSPPRPRSLRRARGRRASPSALWKTRRTARL